MARLVQVQRRLGEETAAENTVKIQAIGIRLTENILGKDMQMTAMEVLKSIHSKGKAVIVITAGTTATHRTPKAKRIGSRAPLLPGTTNTETERTMPRRAGAMPVLQAGGTEVVSMRQTLITPREKAASVEQTHVKTVMVTPLVLPASITQALLPQARSIALIATPRGMATITAGPTTIGSRTGLTQPREQCPPIGTPRPAGAENMALRTPFAPETPPM